MKDPRGGEDAGCHIASVVQIPQRTDLAAKFPEIKGSDETQGGRDIWREDQSGRKQDGERHHKLDGSPNGHWQEVGNDHNDKPRKQLAQACFEIAPIACNLPGKSCDNNR
jgi:hypothetical protein